MTNNKEFNHLEATVFASSFPYVYKELLANAIADSYKSLNLNKDDMIEIEHNLNMKLKDMDDCVKSVLDICKRSNPNLKFTTANIILEDVIQAFCCGLNTLEKNYAKRK